MFSQREVFDGMHYNAAVLNSQLFACTIMHKFSSGVIVKSHKNIDKSQKIHCPTVLRVNIYVNIYIEFEYFGVEYLHNGGLQILDLTTSVHCDGFLDKLWIVILLRLRYNNKVEFNYAKFGGLFL